ncbi:MAG: hypothetical protein JSR18_15200 [Proteobacteria bacterium]|nr:hypothetical protein [Pseudomonadota bacterium]
MKHATRIFIAAVLGLASVSALAQAVTFFEAPGFGGRRFNGDYAISNFEQFGFNDRASSVIVQSGRWQLCSDAYFRGNCVVLNPGRYNDLGAMGLSNRVSSARPVPVGPGPGPGPGNRPPPHPGGGTPVMLYSEYNLGGDRVPVVGPIDNLDTTRWNDRAVSMTIEYGQWQLCSDAYFRGDCQTFGPGRYDNLGGLTRKASSIRPVGGPGGPPPVAGPVYPPDWGGGSRAVLFEGHNLSGRSLVLTQDYVPNLDRTNFNDRASSLRVEGGFWMFCTDADFRGQCRTFGPGDYPNLPDGMENRISSGRRISNAYPYDRNPNWQR